MSSHTTVILVIVAAVCLKLAGEAGTANRKGSVIIDSLLGKKAVNNGDRL